MIPTVLKKAGYVTASVGKWGQMALGPGEWGFNEYLVFPGGGRYWREQTTHYRVNGEQKNLPEGKYLPDILHHFLVDFIARHKDRLFDMSDAPFKEIPVANETTDEAAAAARKRLQDVLQNLVGKDTASDTSAPSAKRGGMKGRRNE
jgi:arylsulfatase A-like enzyme